MKALLLDNKVIELSDVGFPVAEGLIWVDASESVKTGWILEDGELVPPFVPEPTPEEVLALYEQETKKLLLKKAKEKNYDDEQSIASYISSSNSLWQSEAVQFIVWRDEVWIYAYAVLSAAEIDPSKIPSLEDFISNAPVLVWK